METEREKELFLSPCLRHIEHGEGN